VTRRLSIHGPRAALSDPRAHLAIYQQLSTQAPATRREIKLGPIYGHVEGLAPNEPLSPIIEIIKSRASAPPRGGEVRAVADLTKQTAPIYARHMSALELEIAAALGLEEEVTRKSTRDSFTPPAEVRRAAREGLRLRQLHGRGGLDTREAGELGIGSGVQRAADLASGEGVSLETLKKMRGFFSRHQQHKDSTAPDGTPGAGRIAWLLWGGDEGRAWVEDTLQTIRKESTK
jgi:hypothetical protein